MSRRVQPIENLRNSDPVTLEILLGEALRRPLVQVHGATLADMIALADVEALPKALRQSLQAFANRMVLEIHDLPVGEPFEQFLAELESLEPALVPQRLRDGIAAEVEHRGELVRRRAEPVLARWREIPPDVITLGTGKPLIHRVKTHAAPDETRAKRTSLPAGVPRAVRAEAAPKATRAAPTKFVDEDRQQWLVQVLLERLADYLEQGLREDVLIAGVRHRARADYPDMTGAEVTAALRDLQTSGRVKHSAGRWRRVLGGW